MWYESIRLNGQSLDNTKSNFPQEIREEIQNANSVIELVQEHCLLQNTPFLEDNIKRTLKHLLRKSHPDKDGCHSVFVFIRKLQTIFLQNESLILRDDPYFKDKQNSEREHNHKHTKKEKG